MHSPTNYFVRAIEMQKRKKVTYIGTTRPLPGTFDVKKQKARAGASKHQLVLFAIQPFYAFTNHFVRVIEIKLISFTASSHDQNCS